MAKVMKASGKRFRGTWTVRVAGGGKTATAKGASLSGALKKASAKLSTKKKGRRKKRRSRR